MGSMPAVGAGVGLEDPGCVESLTDCVGKNCQENRESHGGKRDE